MVDLTTTKPRATAVPGTKTAAQKFLDTDYIPNIAVGSGQIVTFQIGLDQSSASGIMRLTFNGGTTWFNILNGDQLTGGSILTRPILVRFGDQLNFSSNVEIELGICYVDVV